MNMHYIVVYAYVSSMGVGLTGEYVTLLHREKVHRRQCTSYVGHSIVALLKRYLSS